MEPTRHSRPPTWQLAVAFVAFAAWRAYVIVLSPPEARPAAILTTAVPLAIGIGICIYYFRGSARTLHDRRLSTTAVLLIAVVVIVIAVLFRHV